jgi:hypothetical protein
MQLILREENIIQRLFNTLKLAHRLPPEQLADAIIPLGLNTPKRQALDLQLAPRISHYHNDLSRKALAAGDLMQIIDRVGNIRTVLSRYVPLVTRAIAPDNEEDLRYMLGPDSALLTPFSCSPLKMLETLQLILRELSPNDAMPIHVLEKYCEEHMLQLLAPSDQALWMWPSEHYPDRTLGEHLMQVLIPIAGLSIPLMQIDQTQLTVAPPSEERVAAYEVIKSYLHTFGPATIVDSAHYFGISLEHATRLWEQIPPDELIPVLWEKKEGWILASDADEAQQPSWGEGVRFVSRYDPLSDSPHRSLLIHGKSQYRYFFRSLERPGMVLFDGRCVAGWHMKSQQQSCSFVIEDIGESLGKVALDELETEACAIEQALNISYTGLVVERI